MIIIIFKGIVKHQAKYVHLVHNSPFPFFHKLIFDEIFMVCKMFFYH